MLRRAWAVLAPRFAWSGPYVRRVLLFLQFLSVKYPPHPTFVILWQKEELPRDVVSTLHLENVKKPKHGARKGLTRQNAAQVRRSAGRHGAARRKVVTSPQ